MTAWKWGGNRVQNKTDTVGQTRETGKRTPHEERKKHQQAAASLHDVGQTKKTKEVKAQKVQLLLG